MARSPGCVVEDERSGLDPSTILRRFRLHGRKVIAQKTVEKSIAPTDPLKKNTLRCLVEEPGIVPWGQPPAPQDEAKGEVLQQRCAGHEPAQYPEEQDVPQAKAQPIGPSGSVPGPQSADRQIEDSPDASEHQAADQGERGDIRSGLP